MILQITFNFIFKVFYYTAYTFPGFKLHTTNTLAVTEYAEFFIDLARVYKFFVKEGPVLSSALPQVTLTVTLNVLALKANAACTQQP